MQESGSFRKRTQRRCCLATMTLCGGRSFQARTRTHGGRHSYRRKQLIQTAARLQVCLFLVLLTLLAIRACCCPDSIARRRMHHCTDVGITHCQVHLIGRLLGAFLAYVKLQQNAIIWRCLGCLWCIAANRLIILGLTSSSSADMLIQDRWMQVMNILLRTQVCMPMRTGLTLTVYWSLPRAR